MRAYRLVTPPAQAIAPRPLIIALHGWLGTADQMAEMTNLSPQATARDIDVAYPQGESRAWGLAQSTPDGARDAAFLAGMVADIEKQTPIDPARIFAVGFSNGGFMAQALACSGRVRLAGIAVVSSGLPAASVADCQAPPTRFLLIQGTKDPIVPREGTGTGSDKILSSTETLKFWSARNKCAGLSLDAHGLVHGGWHCRAPTWAIFVEGAGHGWPGGHFDYPEFIVGHQTSSVDATAATLDFFQAKQAVLF
jgi:polyhydroxybutyrate depolymerase